MKSRNKQEFFKKHRETILKIGTNAYYFAGLRILRHERRSLKDLSRDELIAVLSKEARAPTSTPKKRTHFKAALVYTDNLLREARKYRKNKEWEFSYLMYATYFEHWINDIINFGAQEKKIAFDFAKEIIRKTNFEDKLNWVSGVFGLPEIRKNHLATIKKVSETRNKFVHYKWIMESMDEHGKKEIELFRKIESAVRYTEKYEDDVLYLSQRQFLKDFIFRDGFQK